MSDFGHVIGELKKAMAEHAEESLNKREGDAFDYGHACGHKQGLARALEIIDGVLEETDSKPSSFEKHLKGNRK
jgi:hypothetical protein